MTIIEGKKKRECHWLDGVIKAMNMNWGKLWKTCLPCCHPWSHEESNMT